MNKATPLIAIEDILPLLRFIRTKKQEYTLCLALDSGNHLIARRVVTIGTLTASIMHPRDIFGPPLKDRAGSVIIAHNHPSGDPSPSKQDIKTTQQLIAGGQLLGMPLTDHIIVARDKHFSFRANGLL